MINESSKTSELASIAVGNIYAMIILVSERAREIKKTRKHLKYPYAEAIAEAERGKLDVPNLLTRIQKRK